MPTTKTKTSEVIQKKFRNIKIEYDLVSFAVREKPEILALVQSSWFSVKPLGMVVTYVKQVKTVLTKGSLLQEMKTAKGNEDIPFEVISASIDELFKRRRVLTVKSVDVLIRQLHELYEIRRCFFGVQDAVNSLKASDLKKAKKIFRDLAVSAGVTSKDLSGDYLEDYSSRAYEVKKLILARGDENFSPGIPTGIQQFDQLVGGLTKGEFGVIAGKPGIGKTAMMVSFAAHAWLQGYNVLYATIEMPKSPIEFRLDANLAGIPLNAFRLGTISKEQWKTWRQTIRKLRLLQENYLEISSFPRKCSVEDLESEVTRVQEQKGKPVEIVFVDYLNLMSATNAKGGNLRDWGNQGNVVNEIKGFTNDFNGGIVLWTGNQISKDSLDKDFLEIGDLKYAGAIDETAPIVVGLVQTTDDELEKRIQFQVLKFRNSERLPHPIFLYPNLSLMRIHDRVLMRKDLLELDNGDEAPIRKPKAYNNRRRRG